MICGVVALATGLILSACSSDSSTATRSEDSAATTTAPEATSTSIADNTEPVFVVAGGDLPITTARTNEIVAFVEETTGRAFTSEPNINVQPKDEFNQRVETLIEEEEARSGTEDDDPEGAARFFQAVGHTELGAAELIATIDSLSATDQALAYYDPEVDTLFIPDGTLDEATFEIVLVHELVHALDDQYVDLEALLEQTIENPGTDESFAVAAVVEGRATSVQVEWMTTNNVVPKEPPVSPAVEKLPPSFELAQLLPYELGFVMVETLGGAEQTWELYEDLPASSEQVVFPSKIGVDAPVVVPSPAIEGPATNGTVYDEFDIGVADIMLLAASDSPEPDLAKLQQAQLAADGFAGGQGILWGNETESCLTVDVSADSAESAAKIAAVFTSLEPNSTVDQETSVYETTVSFVSCAPFKA